MVERVVVLVLACACDLEVSCALENFKLLQKQQKKIHGDKRKILILIYWKIST